MWHLFLSLFSPILWDYTHYSLALQKCHPSGQYTIHGLWPDFNDVDYPQYCHHWNFSLYRIDDLILDLDQYWYSCQGDNVDFWKHEYLKHGTCSGLPEHSYFTMGLNLYHQSMKHGWVQKYCSTGARDCKIPFHLNFTIGTSG